MSNEPNEPEPEPTVLNRDIPGSGAVEKASNEELAASPLTRRTSYKGPFEDLVKVQNALDISSFVQTLNPSIASRMAEIVMPKMPALSGDVAAIVREAVGMGPSPVLASMAGLDKAVFKHWAEFGLISGQVRQLNASLGSATSNITGLQALTLAGVWAENDALLNIMKGVSIPNLPKSLIVSPQVLHLSSTLKRYLEEIAPRPDARSLEYGVRAGRVVSALTLADVGWQREGPDKSLDDLDELEVLDERFSAAVSGFVQPWESEGAHGRVSLMSWLRSLDEEIANLLAAAWEDIERNGPAAVSKIAHCTVEVLDRTLRKLAQDEEVLAWAQSTGRDGYLSNQGNLTQNIRCKYILRDRKKAGSLASAQIDFLIAQVAHMRSVLQSSKHASTGSTWEMRAHVFALEGFLMQLFVVSVPRPPER